MKPQHTQMMLIIMVPVVVMLVLYFFACEKQAMSATSAALRARSYAVVECLNGGGQAEFGLWPQDKTTQPSHRSSADYFNWLITGAPPSLPENDKKCLRHLREEIVSQLYGRNIFTEKNMPWMIAKNIPEDAPDNFIVLATANVNPASLRTRLTEGDMFKRLEIVQGNPMRVLRGCAFLVRKDGKVIEFLEGRTPNAKYTYREIYDNLPFDLTTNLANGVTVKYLTPTGEVAPTNE